MNTYTPQPGTIPAKVVAYLHGKPPGYQASAAEICEAIGQDPLLPLSNFVGSARKHGILKCERALGQRYMLWSLGDGTPEPGPADNEAEKPLHPAPSTAASPFEKLLPAARGNTQTHQTQGASTLLGQREVFTVGVDECGGLHITRGNLSLTLTASQSKLVARVAAAMEPAC